MKVVCIFCLFIGILMLGCASPEQRAQKLFDAGKYEEVIAQFPNLPITVMAKQKIAEHLLSQGNFEDIFNYYPDTPSASAARELIADSLLKQGKVEEVLQRFPNTKSAEQAREIKLRADANEAAARAALNAAKLFDISSFNVRLHGLVEKEQRLRSVVKQFPGTKAAEEAQQLANEIRHEWYGTQVPTFPDH